MRGPCISTCSWSWCFRWSAWLSPVVRCLFYRWCVESKPYRTLPLRRSLTTLIGSLCIRRLLSRSSSFYIHARLLPQPVQHLKYYLEGLLGYIFSPPQEVYPSYLLFELQSSFLHSTLWFHSEDSLSTTRLPFRKLSEIVLYLLVSFWVNNKFLGLWVPVIPFGFCLYFLGGVSQS